MYAKLLFVSCVWLISFFTNAQTNPLQLHPDIVLPKDSIETKALISSLNNFLQSAQQANEENIFVFKDEKIETFIQLDEIKGIEKSEKYNDDYFFKPYLTSIVLLKDKNYLIQISYIGTNEKVALLRASFEFIAHKTNNTFTFSSPLLQNTENWKILKQGNTTFHYQNTINKDKVKAYIKLTNTYDAKLKVPEKTMDYYLCDNVVALNKLIGVTYKSDYNGMAYGTSTSDFGNRKLVVLGNNHSTFENFDPHDLFHDRLSLVIARSMVNRPVDEGCAYLYGGSWGFSWKEIFKAFKEQVTSNRSTNWLEIKETPVTFMTGNFPNKADYIVNALLVKKIEKEKGFAGVWELLTVGPFENGNEKYYETLEKLTGITKANYNDKVWELIDNEK